MLNALWLPLTFQDTALMTIAVPAATIHLAPANHVLVLSLLASISALAAMLVPPFGGWLSAGGAPYPSAVSFRRRHRRLSSEFFGRDVGEHRVYERSNAARRARSERGSAPLMRPSAPITRCAGMKRSSGVSPIAVATPLWANGRPTARATSA